MARTRQRLAAMWAHSAAIGRTIAGEIGRDEIGLTLALVLLAEGARQVWPPAGWLAPALVLLWIFLPQRQSFVQRPSREKGRE